MKTVILANGEGTRLRPLTYDQPKSLISLDGRPLITHIFERLKAQHLEDIIVTVGIKGQQIIETLGNGEAFGVHLHYAISEDDPAKLPQTAGEIVKAAPSLENEPFLVIYGDTLSMTRYHDMLCIHQEKQAAITMPGIRGVPLGTSYIESEQDGRITVWEEKPTLPILANIPEFICSPDILKHPLMGYGHDFSSEVIPAYVTLQRVFIYEQLDNYHCDIGTLDRLEQAERHMRKGTLGPGIVIK